MANRFSTKEKLTAAVDLWCNNPTQAKTKYGHIRNWDVSSVSDMSELFKDRWDFNDDIGGWEVSNVRNMSEMFHDAKEFNQPIGGWDVSKVTDMWGMFWNARAFNQPIGDWDVRKVTDMGSMFQGASSFNEENREDIEEHWDFSNVTDESNMFLRSNTIQPPTAIRPTPQAIDDYNNIAATPLKESSAVLAADATAFDNIITLEDINVKTYLEANIRNIAFKVGNKYFICTKDDIKNNCINSDSNIIFECKKVDTSIVPRAENVIRDMPYINPRCFGVLVGLFRLSDIKTVLNDPTIRCIEVGYYPKDETGVRALNPRPFKKLVTVASLSMLGRNPNALGALHCQAGQEMYVYSLRKIAVPPAAEMGGSKQTRQSKRKHSKKQKQTKKRGARKTRRA
jgi:surface protein